MKIKILIIELIFNVKFMFCYKQSTLVVLNFEVIHDIKGFIQQIISKQIISLFII